MMYHETLSLQELIEPTGHFFGMFFYDGVYGSGDDTEKKYCYCHWEWREFSMVLFVF
jgi:hypothetical protein